MERATQMLNLLSASVMLVTGGYMQVAFDHLLSTGFRTAIGIVALVYFFLNLSHMSAVGDGKSTSCVGRQA